MCTMKPYLLSLRVKPAYEQYWSFTKFKLCSCVFSGRISYEFGNFKLSVYHNGTMARVRSWMARSCPKIVMLRSRRTRIVILRSYSHKEPQEHNKARQVAPLGPFWLALSTAGRGSGGVVELSYHCGSAIQIAANTVSSALRLVVLILYHCNSVVFVVRGPQYRNNGDQHLPQLLLATGSRFEVRGSRFAEPESPRISYSATICTAIAKSGP